MSRVLLTGASGLLGAYLLRHLQGTGADVLAWHGARDVDLADAGALTAAFRAARPAVVLHAAALARIADCHRQPERAFQVNAAATAVLAGECARAGARLLLVSTDLVFDGESAPYAETAAPAPLSVYGRSKVAAEQAVLAHAHHAVARVGLLFGPTLNRRPSFFDDQASALRSGRPVTLFADEWRTPLDLATAARALSELALSGATGLFHLGGPERLSRLEMGRQLAAALGADPGAIVVATRADVPAAEPRPRDVSLDSGRWRGLFPDLPWPAFGEALRQLLAP
jgi:dTDP-4-dehydrorhamnose reductase